MNYVCFVDIFEKKYYNKLRKRKGAVNMSKNKAVEEIRQELLSLGDEKYKDFLAPIIPNCPKERIIGIKCPQVKALVKKYSGTPEAECFLNDLPHKYHEENLLHAYMISAEKSYDEAEKAVDRFLPYVDNWAVCDSLSPKVFTKNKDKLMEHILERITSEHTYTVRFSIKELMNYYLSDDVFDPSQLELTAKVESEEYYINMMRAWYFATALAKQWEDTIKLQIERRLDKWTHNKTIQKAVESYRITPEQKELLKTLRLK